MELRLNRFGRVQFLLGLAPKGLQWQSSTMGVYGLLKKVSPAGLSILSLSTERQDEHTGHWCCRFRHRHTWIGFFDADEFIWLSNSTVPNEKRIPDINTFLKAYEQYAGLGINWRLFGSNGLQRRTKLPVVEAFTAAFPGEHTANRHVKTFANTKHAVGMLLNPHGLTVRNMTTHPVVNEHFTPFQGHATTSASQDKIALLHYVLKSRSEFAQKIARSSPTRNTRSWQFFEQYDALATETWDGGLWLSNVCGMRTKVKKMQKQYAQIRSIWLLAQS